MSIANAFFYNQTPTINTMCLNNKKYNKDNTLSDHWLHSLNDFESISVELQERIHLEETTLLRDNVNYELKYPSSYIIVIS